MLSLLTWLFALCAFAPFGQGAKFHWLILYSLICGCVAGAPSVPARKKTLKEKQQLRLTMISSLVRLQKLQSSNNSELICAWTTQHTDACMHTPRRSTQYVRFS